MPQLNKKRLLARAYQNCKDLEALYNNTMIEITQVLDGIADPRPTKKRKALKFAPVCDQE